MSSSSACKASEIVCLIIWESFGSRSYYEFFDQDECFTFWQVSWCKFEVTVDLSKNIQVSNSSKSIAEIPPVVVTAINLKTVINEKQVNEIVSASVICCHKAKVLNI